MQENCFKFEANVGNRVRPCFKQIKARKEREKNSRQGHGGCVICLPGIPFVALLITQHREGLEQHFLDGL